MNDAATIAATGFCALCLGAAYYLVCRPGVERLYAGEMNWNSKTIACPVCTHINEIVGPNVLTEAPCGNCGHTMQLDYEDDI